MVFRALRPSEHTCMLDEQGVLPWRLVERLFTKILESYHPRRLDSRGVLFRSQPPDEAYTRAFDDSLGWKNLFAGGLEIIPTLGDHLSMFRQHNQALAQQMNEVLKRYWMQPDDKVNDSACKPRRMSPGSEAGPHVPLDIVGPVTKAYPVFK